MKTWVIAAVAALFFSTNTTGKGDFLPNDVDIPLAKMSPEGSHGMYFCGDYVGQSIGAEPPVFIVTVFRDNTFITTYVELPRAEIEGDDRLERPIFRRRGAKILLRMKEAEAVVARQCLKKLIFT